MLRGETFADSWLPEYDTDEWKQAHGAWMPPGGLHHHSAGHCKEIWTQAMMDFQMGVPGNQPELVFGEWAGCDFQGAPEENKKSLRNQERYPTFDFMFGMPGNLSKVKACNFWGQTYGLFVTDLYHRCFTATLRGVCFGCVGGEGVRRGWPPAWQALGRAGVALGRVRPCTLPVHLALRPRMS